MKTNNKTLVTAVIAIAVHAGATMASGQSGMDKNDLRTDIEKVNKTWMAAVKNQDAEAVAALYAEDAMLMAPNAPSIHGKNGAKDFFASAMSSGIKEVSLSTEEVHGDGDFAIERGAYEMRVDGNTVVDKGKYLVHWKNIDGEWKFYRDMFSSDMPPPAAQPLQKGNVVGVHVATIKLKPGVTDDQFSAYYREKIIPEFEKVYPDTKLYLTRGLRGENANRLGLIYFFASDDIRNQYYKGDGTPTEKGLLLEEKMKSTYDQLAELRESATTAYTDWVIE